MQAIAIVSVDPGPTKSPLTAGEGMPWWLRQIARVAFTPPAVAVAKLYHVGFDDGGYPSGSFVLKGTVKPLPFTEHKTVVLDRTEHIYPNECLALA